LDPGSLIWVDKNCRIQIRDLKEKNTRSATLLRVTSNPVLWIQIHFLCGFGSQQIFFGFDYGFGSLTLIFWNDIFSKWCLSLVSYVFWNLYDRGKSFIALCNIHQAYSGTGTGGKKKPDISPTLRLILHTESIVLVIFLKPKSARYPALVAWKSACFFSWPSFGRYCQKHVKAWVTTRAFGKTRTFYI
jgi:hypothetical protein